MTVPDFHQARFSSCSIFPQVVPVSSIKQQSASLNAQSEAFLTLAEHSVGPLAVPVGFKSSRRLGASCRFGAGACQLNLSCERLPSSRGTSQSSGTQLLRGKQERAGCTSPCPDGSHGCDKAFGSSNKTVSSRLSLCNQRS